MPSSAKIGDTFQGSGLLAEGGIGHITVHATTGGILSELQGGKFGHGFLSAGIAKAVNVNKLMPGSNTELDIRRVVAAAAIGGTASSITGGKFSNGAITAAFAQAYNGNAAEAARVAQETQESEKTWSSYLPGTEAGDRAAQYWADIAVNSDHPLAPLAHVPGVFAALWTDQTAAETGFTLGTAGIGSLVKGAAGPLKQWIRIGPSYSKAAGESVNLSLRWGASPVGGGKYIQQIPSPTLQRFNQWLRGQRLPGNSWRTQDAGHLHIKK